MATGGILATVKIGRFTPLDSVPKTSAMAGVTSLVTSVVTPVITALHQRSYHRSLSGFLSGFYTPARNVRKVGLVVLPARCERVA